MANHVTQRNPDSADEATDARIERNKHIILVLLTVFTTAPFIGYCLYIVFANVGSTDNIRWATSVLAGVIGVLIGRLIGRTSGRQVRTAKNGCGQV